MIQMLVYRLGVADRTALSPPVAELELEIATLSALVVPPVEGALVAQVVIPCVDLTCSHRDTVDISYQSASVEV